MAEAYMLHACLHLDPSNSSGTIDMGQKLEGTVPLWGRRSWVPMEHNVARAEAFLLAKFHLDPSNRLATMHERHRHVRQTGQTDRTSNGLVA